MDQEGGGDGEGFTAIPSMRAVGQPAMKNGREDWAADRGGAGSEYSLNFGPVMDVDSIEQSGDRGSVVWQ